MSDELREALDSALRVLDERIHEGDAVGRVALRVLARAALAHAEKPPAAPPPFDMQKEILLRMWEGPADVFDALVRDAMSWRAARAEGEATSGEFEELNRHYRATPPGDWTTAWDLFKRAMRLLRASHGAPAAPAADARPEGPRDAAVAPTCGHCGAPCVDTAPGSIDPQYGYEFDPSAVPCPRSHLPDEPSEAAVDLAARAMCESWGYVWDTPEPHNCVDFCDHLCERAEDGEKPSRTSFRLGARSAVLAYLAAERAQQGR